MRSGSTPRAPWNVLKNTMKKTISQASTTLARSPNPKTMVTSGTSAIRGSELNATMYGWRTAASRAFCPSTRPATKPLATPTRNPRTVDSRVEARRRQSGTRDGAGVQVPEPGPRSPTGG